MIKQYQEYYDKALSKRDTQQVMKSMEIRARITRESEQAKRLEQKRYERNMGSFIAKLQDKWK
jgi:hypothetical protein